MQTIVLKNTTEKGEQLEAVFLQDLGLNLKSYKKDDLEIIDQSTQAEFENRFSGLGPLIGPHFHHQDERWIVKHIDESLFPHIERVRKKGQKDPFSHGIGRYVPWNTKATSHSLKAHLSSRDTFKGVPLLKFEGYEFAMTFTADLQKDGLEIAMSVESERESLVGLHYYYALSDKKGTVTAPIQQVYNEMGNFKPLPKKWMNADNNLLHFDLTKFSDYGFLPLFEDFSGWILLTTKTHQVKISYQGDPDETSFQLYSPENANFACMEPLSAKNPRKLSSTSSKIKAKIQIISQ